MVELTDFESAEDWLDDQDQQTCICFAARAALRGLTGLGSAEAETKSDLSFANSRAIIISAVAGKMPAADLEKAAEAAAGFILSTSDVFLYAPGSAARYAAYSAAVSDNSFSHCAAFCASDSAEAAARSADPSAQAFAYSAAYSAMSIDTTKMEEAEDPAEVFGASIWHAETMPDGVSKNLQRLRQFWQSAPEVWGFWERWYDGFLNGTPLDWDVQLAVALLLDEDWEKGPEWVAGKIAEIEAEHRGAAKAQLPAEDVAAQSVRLLQRPLLLETNARGLQQLSQMAIDAYRREISNALPDCIEPLENIPGIAFDIACIAVRDVQFSEKEVLLAEQIQLMAGVIAELNGRLKRVPEPAASGRKLFADAFYENRVSVSRS